MCQCAWGIVRQYTILTLLVLQSTVILLRWVPNSHSESLWHVDVYDWAEEAPLGNVCWRITNKDLLQRHLQIIFASFIFSLLQSSISSLISFDLRLFRFFCWTSLEVSSWLLPRKPDPSKIGVGDRTDTLSWCFFTFFHEPRLSLQLLAGTLTRICMLCKYSQVSCFRVVLKFDL